MMQASLQRIIKIFLLLFVFISLFAPLQASAQSPPTLLVDVEYGFQNACKANQWLPIWITLKNNGEDFSGTVKISQSENITYTLPVSIPANGHKEIYTEIFLENNTYTSQNLKLFINNDKNDTVQTITEKPSCTTSPIIGVVSSTPSAFTILNSPTLRQSIQNPEIAFFDITRMPSSESGLQALSYLVISNMDVTQLSTEQHEAITTWVSQGGQLILSGGSKWQTNLAGFENILPLDITNSSTSNLHEGFKAFDLEFSVTDIVVSTGSSKPNAKILLEENEVPLVALKNLGLGSVTLLTFDPNHPTFRSWSELEFFYDFILNQSQQQTALFQDSYAAQNAATLFPNLNIPPLWMVCGVLLFYIVLVGPANYIILGFMKKREWAWVTIPSLIILFSLAFILLGNGTRGNQPSSNHLALVQFSPGDETAQVRGLYGVFSPTRKNYQFEIETGFNPFPLSGGTYYNNSLETEWDFIDSQAYIANTRIDTAGLAALGIQGAIPAPKINISSVLEVRSGQIYMTGTVENNTDLTLEGSVIAYPGNVLEIGTLAPGDIEHFDILLNSSYMLNSAPSPASRLPNGNGNITIDQILGYSYYSSPELTKRAKFLEALFGYYNIPAHGNTNFIFIGWNTTQAPFQIKINDHDPINENLTGYLIPLNAEFIADNQPYEVPPFLFDWQFSNDSVIDNYESPYDLSLSSSETIKIMYQLNPEVSWSKATDLILHIYGTHDEIYLPADISLWNYSAGQWDTFDFQDWGDYALPSTIYMSKQGQIQVQITNGSTANFSYLHFSEIDFTLIVEP